MQVDWVDYDVVTECASNAAQRAINAREPYEHTVAQDLERRLDDLAARIAAHLGDRPEDSDAWLRPRPPGKLRLVDGAAAQEGDGG